MKENFDFMVNHKEKQINKIKPPKMVKVIMHNDDYTTMEFVVKTIVSVFHKTNLEATKIMMDVHNKGKGIVGSYPYDIAITKIKQVHIMARNEGFPFKLSVEEE